MYVSVPNQLFPDEPSSHWSAPFFGAGAEIPLAMADNMADGETTKRKSLRKSGHSRKDNDVKDLMQIKQEETISFSLENAIFIPLERRT